MTTLDILKKAKAAKTELAKLSSQDKNNALLAMADSLEECCAEILEQNKKDVEAARGKISDVMIDRLSLDESRIKGMADGIRDVVKLPDPVGKILDRVELANGLIVEKTAVPMGLSQLFTKADRMFPPMLPHLHSKAVMFAFSEAAKRLLTPRMRLSTHSKKDLQSSAFAKILSTWFRTHHAKAQPNL